MTRETPEWVEHLKGDTIPRSGSGLKDDYWTTTQSMPRRFHGGEHGGGYHHGWGQRSNHYDYGDTSGLANNASPNGSLRSSKSARGKRAQSCGLILLLILGALLLALGIGLLVYFLLLSSPGFAKHAATTTNNEMRVLNTPYHPSMANTSSTEFKTVATPFCEEINKYFKDSQYKDRYQSCKLTELKPDMEALVCQCAGILKTIEEGSVRVFFQLKFKGDLKGLPIDIPGIIEQKTRKMDGKDYRVLFLRDFIVDVRQNTGRPEVGVLGNLTIWVYNLTYSNALRDRKSMDFLALANPFCDDIDRIFLSSHLRWRYFSCELHAFNKDPNRAITYVSFTGDNTEELQRDIAKTIMERARQVIVDGKMRKMIGTLLITPAQGDGNIKVVTIPVNPGTTISPTPTLTPSDSLYIDMRLFIYNLTYQPALGDKNSVLFKDYSQRFCKDLERMIRQSEWKNYFYDCEIIGFYPPEQGKEFMTLRALLKVANPFIYQPENLVKIIRSRAPEFDQFRNDGTTLKTYLVGDLLVILADGSFILRYTPYTPSVLPSTSTRDPMTFGSIFTSYSFVEPTPGMTIPGDRTTRVIIYNSTNAFIDAHLYGFGYTTDLDDKTSQRFLRLQSRFCTDIDRYFKNSQLREIYLDCSIDHFKPSPDSLVFKLSFAAPLGDYLAKNITSIIETKAPHELQGSYELLDVGDLRLIWNQRDFVVSVTNFTGGATPTISPSKTQPITSTVGGTTVYSAALADISCSMFNKTLPFLLNDRTSGGFVRQQSQFCEDIARYYGKGKLSPSYLNCYIIKFRRSPTSVNFHLIFGDLITPTLKQAIIDELETHAPNYVIDNKNVFEVGDLMLEKGSCNVTMYPVNYTQPDVIFPTISPTGTIITPSSLEFNPCLRNPCRNGATCTESFDSYFCECPEGWTGSDCSRDIDECSVNRCKNGGTCENRPGTFVCRCPSGWMGEHCEIDIDECSVKNPCLYGGVCRNTAGGFFCVCPQGRTGQICEENVYECQEKGICLNNGTCVDTAGSYYCLCTNGWTGDHCEIDINECERNPCQHGGTCYNNQGSFTCSCPPEWQGPYCEKDVHECQEFPGICQNGGNCFNLVGGYMCRCLSGWTGTNCEADIRECDMSPCKNKARCIEQSGSYECACPPGFSGINCEKDTDECVVFSPCKNGATCINEVGSYRCICSPGWSGQNCTDDYLECAQMPCLNGGTCQELPGSFKCTCPQGFTGPTCDIDINECDRYPCGNGARCINTVGGYYCVCPSGFTGESCRKDLDECDPALNMNPCQNEGTCMNTYGKYYCVCADGWSGVNCTNDFNECEYQPCANSGTCVNTPGSYYCKCLPGYSGPVCGSDVNECLEGSNACLNNGTCVNTIGSFFCRCREGWSGPTCGTFVDICLTTTCENGGTCIGSPGQLCECPPGWEGPDCSRDVNECVVNQPCNNGGTCINTAGGFQCVCTAGYTGTTCQSVHSGCLFSPCKNGASCMDGQDGTYVCKCRDGWKGDNCERDVDECNEMVNSCDYGGRCVNLIGGYECICPDGRKGKTCQEDINECLLFSPCQNGATCVNTDGSYQCFCPDGWEGTDCDIDVNECTRDVCTNGGTCENLIGSYRCYCPPNWTGPNCRKNKKMPPKRNRSSVINIKNEDLVLCCEWEECQETFKSMDIFMNHMSGHLNQHFQSEQRNTEESEGFHCLWRECCAEIEGEPSDFIRHVYFHTFHVKIKGIGVLLLEKTGQKACTLDTQSSRNLIPELPERLECGWDHCHFMFENAEMFYRHVENHGDSFPEGNNVLNGCKCGWEGCDVLVKSKHKLKDHLRSHTQEKLVACPTCGALFSSRTKFFDHLKRQVGSYTGKRYQCSHCNRTFASERLLRDHMRGHVNQYKCPYCDMTSPSPSCLRLHIRYRHSEEKPFKCDQCDHSCKSPADLKKHMDTHNDEDIYHCQVAGCKYSARGYQSLTNHYKYRHQSSQYECHVCCVVFSRGTLLTKHLKSAHDFSWPSGHSRFRYKLHSDGMFRLQTVRYEAIQLSTQTGDQNPQPVADVSDQECERVPEVNTDFENSLNLETFDALNDQNSMFKDGIEMEDLVARSSDTNIQSSPENNENRKRHLNEESVNNNKITKVLSDSSNLEDSSKESEEVVKIRITLDKDGQCLLQTEDTPIEEAVAVSVPGRGELEENMYNLRMLGEVALQNQTKK